MYVYRDNEPVQDRMRQQLLPLTKHIHVISTKNLSKFGSRFLAMSQIHTLRFVFGAKLIINQRDRLAKLKTEVLEQAGFI